MRRLRLVLLLAGALLVAGGLVVGTFAQRSQASLDHTLTLESEEHAGIAAHQFAQARDLALLMAQNPVFAQYYAGGPRDAALAARISEALHYSQVLYEGRIVDACFIDATGRENARVVQGEAVPAGKLSSDVSGYDFVKPAFALQPGAVYQGLPYVSPESGEWVVATATPVPGLAGGAHAILHFETTIESIRYGGSPSSSRYIVQVLDRTTGAVISDSRVPQLPNARLAAPATRLAARLRSDHRDGGVISLDGGRIAFRSVAAHQAQERGSQTDATVNANDWVVAVSAPAQPAAWASPFSTGPVGLLLGGLAVLALAVVGYRRHYRHQQVRARTDGLTGLGNRFALQEQLAGTGPGGCAVLLLDLDRFKAVNDTLGHVAGDQLLVEVANRLPHAVGPGQFVARLGGDEFAVLIRRIEDPDQPAQLAETVLAAIRRPMTFEGVPIAVSTSIGIALGPEHGSDPSRLLRCADVAMYHAKRTGSGYCVYSGDQETHSLVRLGLEASMVAAIEQRQLVLHYQPIVDSQGEQVRRVEALVRWRHPDLGLIQPREFVSLAEETGLARELTHHVLEIALDQCAQWLADGLDLPVSVNLSPKNCVDTQLPDTVAAMLAARKLPPSVLRLEVTEHAAVGAEAADVLGRVHRLGVSVALDDFGTGYSSLAYLRLLSVDDIKIDRTFVAALAQDPTDTVIIGSTIDMAHQLGCSVTAEGVEDEQTLRTLALLGTDSIQGFHICHPLPADELRRWLASRPAAFTVPASDARELRKH